MSSDDATQTNQPGTVDVTTTLTTPMPSAFSSPLITYDPLDTLPIIATDNESTKSDFPSIYILYILLGYDFESIFDGFFCIFLAGFISN